MKKKTTYTTGNHQFINLEKYQSIDVEGDWEIVKDRINFQRSRRHSIVWRAAAIAIILLGVGFIAQQYVLNPPELLSAMTGAEQKDVLLPDGSHVFLNKYTELTYPEKFTRGHRKVTLKGEGFFEVTSNPAKPFQVNVADRASVEVLGTSFNIRALASDESVSVQVVEGKVAFYARGQGNKRTILEKDDQAEMQHGIIEKNTWKNLNFLSWKTGIIHFDQDAIEQVVDILSNHYNLEIMLDQTVDTQLTFTSVIDNQELGDVLEELSLVLGVSCSIQEEKVKIYMTD